MASWRVSYCSRLSLGHSRFSVKVGLVCTLKGFQHVSLSSSSSQDVDECSPPAEPCGKGHHCLNSPGSFRCECKAGYYFDGISRTCVGM